jgi:phosphoribosylaminoimidazolecarboxamide formyltransferase / IMP cyclohydrolase
MSAPSRPARRALLSVSNKRGLIDFAHALVRHGFTLLSTGGTAAALRSAGLVVTDVSAVTGFPEIMDGRVKTLHPRIHGGLLGRPGLDDQVMERHGIGHIELLVVNLYPFRETVARPGCGLDEAIEQIDVGGPAMIRAAAKNHQSVAVVTRPDDYPLILAELDADGRIDAVLRRRLATTAFAETAAYDAAIAQWLEGRLHAAGPDTFPEVLGLQLHKVQTLRYGENPHQSAALYADAGAAACGLIAGRQVHGKPLSFNNLADADAALACVSAFNEPACVIVKHANPCGVASAHEVGAAYDAAFACDPTSAFGGIIAFNRPLDPATARRMLERQFVEVVLAPVVEPAALAVFADKPAVRVVEVGSVVTRGVVAWDLRQIQGGMLVQQRDCGDAPEFDCRVVSQRRPDPDEWDDLRFLWTVVRFVKSNAIVIGRARATIGVGAGQMSRVWSTRIACDKAREAGFDPMGSCLASDAFFPFADGIEQAAAAGVRAIIQPGGSLRDAEVIAAADRHGLAMVFTGVRHFRH